jgi:hypothetical protein
MKFFSKASVEDPETGYVKGGKLLARVTVKVDPVWQLCVAAATLQFNRHGPRVLEGFDEDVVSDMLSSDALGVDSEEELLSIIVGAKLNQKIEGLLAHVRLRDISLPRLLTATQASSQLRQSAAFKDLLKKVLKETLSPGPVPVLNPPRTPRGSKAQPVHPSEVGSVDALVEWLATPTPIEAELSDTKHRLDETVAASMLTQAELSETKADLSETKRRLDEALARIALIETAEANTAPVFCEEEQVGARAGDVKADDHTEDARAELPDAAEAAGAATVASEDRTGSPGMGDGPGEETRQCSVCGSLLPLAAFSSRQWKIIKQPRRCIACIDH